MEDRKPIIDVVDKFEVNTVVWLRSLPENELGPSRRMVEDIEAFAKRGGLFQFEEISVSSSAEMLAALATLASRCRAGLRPILHFDCHGLKNLDFCSRQVATVSGGPISRQYFVRSRLPQRTTSVASSGFASACICRPSFPSPNRAPTS